MIYPQPMASKWRGVMAAFTLIDWEVALDERRAG